MLESLFGGDAIADDGFSRRVVTRIRLRIWLRRLALPVAMIVGGAVAIGPATDLIAATTKLLQVAPQGLIEAPAAVLPLLQEGVFGASMLQTIVLGAMLLGAGVLGARLLSE